MRATARRRSINRRHAARVAEAPAPLPRKPVGPVLLLWPPGTARFSLVAPGTHLLALGAPGPEPRRPRSVPRAGAGLGSVSGAAERGTMTLGKPGIGGRASSLAYRRSHKVAFCTADSSANWRRANRYCNLLASISIGGSDRQHCIRGHYAWRSYRYVARVALVSRVFSPATMCYPRARA